MAFKKPYFSLHEIALLSLCAALIVVLNTTFTLPLNIPGHTGIYWVVPVIIGVGIVKKPVPARSSVSSRVSSPRSSGSTPCISSISSSTSRWER